MNSIQSKIAVVISLGVLAAKLLSVPALAQTTSDRPAAASSSAALTPEDTDRLIGGSTLITLHVKNAPLRRVIEEIARQAKINLRSRPETMWQAIPQKITLDIEWQPYWLAIRAVSVAAHLSLSLSRWGREPVWNLTQSDDLHGPYVVKGPFLVVANGIEQQHTITTRFGTGERHEDLRDATLNVTGFADPKLSITGYSPFTEIDEVVDEHGHSLKRNFSEEIANDGLHPFMLRSSSNQTFFVSLHLLPSSGRRIARLRGRLHFLQLKRSETWEVPDILSARDVSRVITANGETRHYIVNDVREIGDEYQVRMEILPLPSRSVSSTSAEPHFLLSPGLGDEPFFSLLDAKGNRLASSGFSSGSGGGHLNLNVSFSRRSADGGFGSGAKTTGKPVKLVLGIPAEFTEITVPFEFTNLPLP